jgi:hypothetical protein
VTRLAEADRRRVLALARATLGELEPEADAAGTIAALEALLDLMVARDRRLALLALRLANLTPVFFGRGTSVRRMQPAAAEAHMNRLARSRLPGWRRLARIVKAMLAYAYYGRPAAWPALGYDGPWVGRVAIERLPDPVLERPTERS